MLVIYLGGDPRTHQYMSGENGKKPIKASRLVLWATGNQSFGKLLGERVQHFSVILPEGQRGWGVYPPTAISHWLKAATGGGTHELTLPACPEG